MKAEIEKKVKRGRPQKGGSPRVHQTCRIEQEVLTKLVTRFGSFQAALDHLLKGVK